MPFADVARRYGFAPRRIKLYGEGAVSDPLVDRTAARDGDTAYVRGAARGVPRQALFIQEEPEGAIVLYRAQAGERSYEELRGWFDRNNRPMTDGGRQILEKISG